MHSAQSATYQGEAPPLVSIGLPAAAWFQALILIPVLSAVR